MLTNLKMRTERLLRFRYGAITNEVADQLGIDAAPQLSSFLPVVKSCGEVWVIAFNKSQNQIWEASLRPIQTTIREV